MYLVMAAGHLLPVPVPRYAQQKKSTPPAPVPHEDGNLATASIVVMNVDHQARRSWFVIAAPLHYLYGLGQVFVPQFPLL